MSKISVFDTVMGKQADMRTHLDATAKFLIANRNQIVVPRLDRDRLLRSSNTHVHSVISDMISSMTAEGIVDIFQFLDLAKVSNIPAGFVISWLDIDTKVIGEVDAGAHRALNMLPEFKDKILTDITPFASKDMSRITDISALHSHMIRGALMRSYETFGDMWLSPNMINMFAKFYAMILSNKIGRLYNLGARDQMSIAGVFAIYFIYRCSASESPDTPMISKLDYVNKLTDVKTIQAMINDYHTKHKSFTFDDAIKVIVELSPSLLHNFNADTFRSMNFNLSSNQIGSLLSLEYPPYWCYQILDALSGAKTSIFHTIKNVGLKDDAGRLAVELAKTKTFVNSLSN